MAAHHDKKNRKKLLAPKLNNTFKKSFKDNKKTEEPYSTGRLSTSLLVQDDDPAFPRGGASVLSREERAEARAEVEAEFYRENNDFKKGKDKRYTRSDKKKPFSGGDNELGSLFGEGVTGRLPRFANRVTRKNISPNMKLWGVIIEVNEKDLVLSLPGGLRGFVRSEDVSDIVLDNTKMDTENKLLHNIFHVGQLVSCIVLRVDDDNREGKGNKKILLSLRLSLLYKSLTLDAVQDGMVLTAQVKSVEDHGYILHFGVSLFTGFLPRSGHGDSKFCRGQLLQCTVKSVDQDRSVVHLNADPELVSKNVVKDLKGLSIDLLFPGMMVNARVHSTLDNGIMLSFLTYFTGTADIFHLQNPFPIATWKDEYDQNKKVNARILFIDPSTRAIGLTLNSHLIHNKTPPSYAKTGDIYDNSRVIRVDRGTGLLLEIPSSPKPSPAYVSILDAADGEDLKLEKMFKEGSKVRVRIIAIKHLEGLATGSLKGNAFEGSVFTYSDVKPGMLLKAKVIAVDIFGAIVQFPSGLKALCPLTHMSELEIVKPSKRFKVGAELPFRVLGCKSKRITVTHKKTLLKSKLRVLSSYADAVEGLVTHGWINKIEKHGCYMKFYNGVQGFAHRSELALDPGSEADAVYHVGQVVKCMVISSLPTTHKVNLSFVISPKRPCQDDAIKIGCVVSGVVERLTDAAVVVNVHSTGFVKGVISNEHLADHTGQVTSFKSSLKPGYKFDQLLVLDIEGQNFILSAKYSLISNFQEVPSDALQIRPSSVVQGYICNIIETGCFVRFLGRLTGFSLKYKVTDEKVDNVMDAFCVGQSVRSYIVNVNSETSRIKLSLKQSLCFSTDVSYIQSYFSVEEKIATLQSSDAESSNFSWVNNFSIGTVVEGEVQERKELGLVLSFKDYPDVVGFVANHQLGGSDLEKGSVVRAVVLDVDKSEGLIELSLKPEFIISSATVEGSSTLPSKKRRGVASLDLELHKTVKAVVEIVKENYLVLSIPDNNYAIGYASVMDYNTQKLSPKHFVPGQSIFATVGKLPNPDSFGRLLLLVKCSNKFLDTSSSKRAKKTSSCIVDSLVEAEVIEIKSLHLVVKFGNGFRGRVHITEIIDDHSLENPVSKFKIGQLLNARIVAETQQSGKKAKGYDWELSLRPSVLSGLHQEASGELNFPIGSVIRGYVVRIKKEWVWLIVSRHIRACIYILDSSCEPSELQIFRKRYSVGQPVKGRIISVQMNKRLLRLKSCLSSLMDSDTSVNDIQESNVSDENDADNIMQGDTIGGRVQKILPGVGGLLVQIGPYRYGNVHYTELADTWVPHPLSGYEEGKFVKCKVLEKSRSSEGLLHYDLSLRPSLVGIQSTSSSDTMDSSFERVKNVDGLHPGMEVKGYVKNVTSKGCFVTLSRKIDARIFLSNLSNDYVAAPEKEFPVGLLVHGRVLSVDPSLERVDVTLKKDIDTSFLFNVKVGEVVSGLIRRIEPCGLFIKIDHIGMVGLCHTSELSDEHLDNIEDRYKAGDRVVAKILKVDEDRRQIALGMKRSYNADTNDVQDSDHVEDDDDIDYSAAVSNSLPKSQQNESTQVAQMIVDQEAETQAVLSQAESRSTVLPLQVLLDESEDSGMDDDATVKKNHTDDNLVDKKNNRREKRKAREERELEIRAAEERILQNDIPQTEEEFEKLVRSPPE